MLDSLYGQVMRMRRRRYERRPERQRRLSRPVISVGNLSMGGTGKTPVVAAIARFLVEAGHRPSILTRGYGRQHNLDGVVVIDPQTPISRTGDEPLMLSRQVPGATVCVSPDRFLAGRLAEQRGCSIHVLDDGFQHLELARDLDVLVTTVGEIPNGRVIPAGRLREPRDAAARAHFLVVSDATAGAAAAEAWTLGISQSCGALRSIAVPVENTGQKVLAVAGIAHPDRFVGALKANHWHVVDALTFPDHHRYTAANLAAIEARMQSAGAEIVLTTEKDAVRLEPLAPSVALGRVSLIVAFDPPHALFDSVKAVLR